MAASAGFSKKVTYRVFLFLLDR